MLDWAAPLSAAFSFGSGRYLSDMADALTLRRAEIADIPALDDLFQRSYLALLKDAYPPSVLVTAVPVIGRAQPALIRSGLFHVVEQDGAIIAAGGWSLSAPGGGAGTRGVGHVRHVASDPHHLRKGAAQRVLDWIKTEAKASGMAQLHCQSTLNAVPFYEAMGFEPRGEVIVPLRGGIDFPAVFMTAQI